MAHVVPHAVVVVADSTACAGLVRQSRIVELLIGACFFNNR